MGFSTVNRVGLQRCLVDLRKAASRSRDEEPVREWCARCAYDHSLVGSLDLDVRRVRRDELAERDVQGPGDVDESLDSGIA